MLRIKTHPTKIAFLLSKALDAPFWGIYNILPFLLYKELDASSYEIAFLMSLKPIVSLFSLYWSKWIHNRPDKILPNIVLGKILGLFLFLFSPLVRSVPYFVAASALFMMLCAGSQPAWLELLKRSFSWQENKRTFATGAAIGYLGGGLSPFFFGYLMDKGWLYWDTILMGSAILSLFSLPAIFFFPSNFYEKPKFSNLKVQLRLAQLIAPWKTTIHLLKNTPVFLSFQAVFMIFGIGLMIIQPALPDFFINYLGLSYMELGLALSLCKGIAYSLSSPVWSKTFSRIDILKFTGLTSAFATLFPLALICATMQSSLVYGAYLLYGVIQAGSELMWNMSGPLFSGKEDSSPYTSVNVLAIGIRGLFAPFLGGILCTYLGPIAVLLMASCTFFTAATAAFVSDVKLRLSLGKDFS